MGNTSVKDIRAAGLAVVKSVLGTGWQEAEWHIDPAKNSIDFRDQSFFMMPLAGPAGRDGAIQMLWFDQKFALFLTRSVLPSSGDADAVAAADQLMGLMVDCMLQLVKLKFNAPVSAGVMNVGDPSYKEPIYKKSGELLILEGEITVTFKVNYS